MGGKAKRLFLSPLRQAYSSTLLVCTCSFQNMLTLRWSSEPKLSGVVVVWVMRFCEIESFRSFGQWALIGSASLRHLDPLAAATAPSHGTSTQCLDVFGVFDEICRIGCWRNSVSIYFHIFSITPADFQLFSTWSLDVSFQNAYGSWKWKLPCPA